MRWTSKLAYLVGLIVTDGNLSKDGRHISLKSADYQLLEAFQNCLGRNYPIKKVISYENGTERTYFRIQFSNVNLYRWFLKIGLTPAKTHTIHKIKIPDKYFRDFLRGHLDGDGSVTSYTDNYVYYKDRNYTNFRVMVRFISVSEAHIRWLFQTIQRVSNLQGSLHKSSKRDPRYVPMWTIKFAKKESIKLIQFMYYQPDLPCLHRKYLKAMQILSYTSSETRKVYTRISK